MQTLLIILCLAQFLVIWMIASRLISISRSINCLRRSYDSLEESTRYILEKTGIMSRFPFKSTSTEEVE